MTKDRRLGRGLAALLGTPLDEENGLQRGGNGTSATFESPETTSAGMLKGTKPDDADRIEMLRALNGEARENASTANARSIPIPHEGHGSFEIPVTEIDNNPFQPRKMFEEEEIAALAASFKEHEQLQPILVRKVGNRYQLISGERRLRAAVHAGLSKIRAEVREADDRMVAELAIVENLQRKDLNPVEKALSFKNYLGQHKCTQEELAKRLKVDRSTIANLMRLLELPEAILEAIQRDELSAGHARSLLPLGDEGQQMSFAALIRKEGWSVRETERRVTEALEAEEAEDNGSTGPASRSQAKRTKSDHLVSLEQELKLALGTKVEIRQASKGRGKIVISFSSEVEFDRIREAFSRSTGSHAFRAA